MPTTVVIAVLSVGLAGCSGQGPAADCGNEILIDCAPDGSRCFCAAGPNDGMTCVVGPDAADDPDGCETLCLYCGLPEAAPGPRSILLGL